MVLQLQQEVSFMTIPGNTGLFEGIGEKDMASLLECLPHRLFSARKGRIVIREGDAVDSVGIVLSGFIQVLRVDDSGNRVIQAGFSRGDIFAESLVCAGLERSPVRVVASEASELLFFPYRKLIGPCGAGCSYHTKLVENLVGIIARKNLMLNGKLAILSKRTIREKLLAYLSEARAAGGSAAFTIPFTRGELADYLCVDRSALSRELSNMRDEGLLLFDRKSFSFPPK
jgi:CRP/FNR family transcriptional regulator, dissimilatory nitrate respiration regulator